ncbi:MAG: YegP family protein [Thermoplasmatales archaeon]|nr:YegP family protein [Thermoplasmatales archaeon]
MLLNLVARNNEIIATSEMYTTKQSCINGINSVKTNAPRAPIRDNTV